MWENYLDEVKYPSFNLSPISFHIAGDNGVKKKFYFLLKVNYVHFRLEKLI